MLEDFPPSLPPSGYPRKPGNHNTVLDVSLLEDTPNIKKPELKDLMAKYYIKRKGVYVRTRTGHLLDEMFQPKEKQLALTFSLDIFGMVGVPRLYGFPSTNPSTSQ